MLKFLVWQWIILQFEPIQTAEKARAWLFEAASNFSLVKYEASWESYQLYTNHNMGNFKFKLKHLYLGIAGLATYYFLFTGSHTSSNSPIGSADSVSSGSLLTYAANILNDYTGKLDPVKFNWNQALDLSLFFKENKNLIASLTCEEFANRIRKTERTYYNCHDDKENEIPLILPESINLYINNMERIIYGKTHLAKSLPNPSKLVFLLPGDEYVEVPVDKNPQEVGLKSLDLHKIVKKFDSKSSGIVGKEFTPIELNYDDFNYRKSLDKFMLDELLGVKQLHDKYAESKRARKYFGEAYVLGKEGKFDLDWRFYSGPSLLLEEDMMSAPVLSDWQDKNKRYSQLIRTWEMFCRQRGVVSWISDVDLIGWRFNGVHLPMDSPNGNFQMPISSLLKLVHDGYNQSLIFNYFDNDIDPKGQLKMIALLDISPYFKMRDRNNKENLIDMRLIDVETGLYMNIQALSTFQYEKLNNFKAKPIFQSLTEVDQEKLDRYLEMYKDDKTTLLNNKNLDIYNFNDFSTLLPVMYENYLTYIPHDYVKPLTTQYFDPFTVTRYNFRFREGISLWVPLGVCKLPPFVNSPTKEQDQTCLQNPVVNKIHTSLKPATDFHDSFMTWFNEQEGYNNYRLTPKHSNGFLLT